jgi:pimeloyl-ACP methyl ester carboxylesterase
MTRSPSSPVRLVAVATDDRPGPCDAPVRPSHGRPAAHRQMPAVAARRGPISRSAIGAAREVRATAAAVWGVPSGLVHDTARETRPRAGSHRQPSTAIGDRGRNRGRTAPPVVLVHGFAGSSTSWFAVRRALGADRRMVVSFDYPPWASSVDELADRLIETVEDVLAATGAGKVHLVGHSLGGVIIALALTRDRLAGCVDLVVTLGSPFSGSPWADVLPLCPLVRALRSGSPLLRRLAAAPAPAGVRWLAFASTLDAIVPAHRAVPANRHATRVMIEADGHSGMLLDPDVIARIVAATTLREDDADLGAPLAA